MFLPKSSTGFISILTILLVILLVAATVGGWLYFQSQPIKQELPRQLQIPTPKPTPTPGPTQTYTNKDLGFSFSYPKTWILTDFKAATGSAAAKIAHTVLQLKPGDYTNSLVPIKLIYWDNPNKLSLSDLDKRLTASASGSPMPIVYSGTDDYVLTGSGLTANLRNDGSCENKKCQIYTFSDVSKVYQLESFLDANIYNQKDVLDQIVNSFKFSDFAKQSTLGASTSAIRKR